MNNTYLIREKELKVALDNISSFQEKIELFIEKHPKYNYSVKIIKENDEWLIELNIKTKDEQTDTQTS